MKLKKCVSALLAFSLLVLFAAIGEDANDDITGIWVNGEGEEQKYFEFTPSGEMKSNADGNEVTGTYTAKENEIVAEINYMGITGTIKWAYSLNGDTLTINDVAYARHFEELSDAELLIGKWTTIIEDGSEMSMTFLTDGIVLISRAGTDVQGEYALEDGIISMKLNLLGSVMEKSSEYAFAGDTLTFDGAVYTRDIQRLFGEWYMSLDDIKVVIDFMPDGKLVISMSDAVKVEGTYGVNGNKLSLTTQNGATFKTKEVEFGFVGDKLKIDNDLYTRTDAE